MDRRNFIAGTVAVLAVTALPETAKGANVATVVVNLRTPAIQQTSPGVFQVSAVYDLYDSQGGQRTNQAFAPVQSPAQLANALKQAIAAQNPDLGIASSDVILFCGPQ